MRTLLFIHVRWCGLCNAALRDVIKPLMEECPGQLKCIDVDVDWKPAVKYKVTQLPAVILLEDEELVHKQTGVMAQARLADWLQGGPL